MIKTTEVTSYEIASDNVLNQRLFFAYQQAASYANGKILEIGCGMGKGLELFQKTCQHYSAVDKNPKLIDYLQSQYPNYRFVNSHIPPLPFPDSSFDAVITLQVIEHIQDDRQFLKEIQRVLKPNGRAVISTPNSKLSLSRNPWHVREYTGKELENLLNNYFPTVAMMGVAGDQKVMSYHEENRKSVAKITKFDIFNFQYRLPRQLLQVPYELLNRLNRNRLMSQDSQLIRDISTKNFLLSENIDQSLDLFCVVQKN